MTTPTPEQQHRRTVKVSTIVSTTASFVGICVVVLPITWRYFLAPVVIATVSQQVAAQVQQNVDSAVQKRVAPLNEGFKVILQQQIEQLERDVDRLEFEQRQANLGQGGWTLDKVNELRDKRNQLAASRGALLAILTAESQ